MQGLEPEFIVECFQGLHSLHLCLVNPGSAFANDIASYVRQNRSLRELSLRNSCGGDEGAATLMEMLTENDTLKIFSLAAMELSSDTLTGFANVLASNSTLEMVNLTNLLPELTALLRKEGCCPELSVSVTSSARNVVLRKFFEALAADKTLRVLRFPSNEDTFEAFADGIVSVLKSTTTLREVRIAMCVDSAQAHQIVGIFDALKQNHSVAKVTINAETVTPEIATSLSELLAVNNTLNDVVIFNYSGISPGEMETIVKASKTNYTLINFVVHSQSHDSEGIPRDGGDLKEEQSPQKQSCGVRDYGR
ncbi:hypothetical protein MTO96_023004 [Rhipicephalus appendiculatus]